jgi:serine/threonine protein kinase
MLQFKHDHILRLLAVCVDGEPFYLLLELMDGGDLLSHLRANRPTAVSLESFLESNSVSTALISLCLLATNVKRPVWQL